MITTSRTVAIVHSFSHSRGVCTPSAPQISCLGINRTKASLQLESPPPFTSPAVYFKPLSRFWSEAHLGLKRHPCFSRLLFVTVNNVVVVLSIAVVKFLRTVFFFCLSAAKGRSLSNINPEQFLEIKLTQGYHLPFCLYPARVHPLQTQSH